MTRSKNAFENFLRLLVTNASCRLVSFTYIILKYLLKYKCMILHEKVSCVRYTEKTCTTCNEQIITCGNKNQE